MFTKRVLATALTTVALSALPYMANAMCEQPPASADTLKKGKDVFVRHAGGMGSLHTNEQCLPMGFISFSSGGVLYASFNLDQYVLVNGKEFLLLHISGSVK